MQAAHPTYLSMLQARTRTLDGTLRGKFEQWYPGLQNDDAAGKAEQLAVCARDAYNWALDWFKDRREAGEPCPAGMLFPFWQEARATLYPHYEALCPSAARCATRAESSK